MSGDLKDGMCVGSEGKEKGGGKVKQVREEERVKEKERK